MKPQVAPPPQSQGLLAELYAGKALDVIDLWTSPAHRALWKTECSGGPAAPPPTDLPLSGFASPMGFWLSSPAVPRSPAPAGLAIVLVDHGEDTGPTSTSFARSPFGPCTRPVQTVRVKSPSAGEGDLTLTLGPGGARVQGTPAAWKTLAEPVLLAVCQYWRFAALENEIARLTERAHGDLDHANMPGVATLKAHDRVVSDARAVRALLLDVPHFEGPLADAFPYVAGERSAAVYESLAEKLRLEDWCELIDERSEAVEDAYEALTEKLFEYKNFAWEAALETLIIVILLAELAVQVYEAFTP